MFGQIYQMYSNLSSNVVSRDIKQSRITSFFRSEGSSRKRLNSTVAIDDDTHAKCVKRQRVNLVNSRTPSESNASIEESCGTQTNDYSLTEDEFGREQATEEHESSSFMDVDRDQMTSLINMYGTSSESIVSEDPVVGPLASSSHSSSSEVRSPDKEKNSDLQYKDRNKTDISSQSMGCAVSDVKRPVKIGKVQACDNNLHKNRKSLSAVEPDNETNQASNKREKTSLPRPIEKPNRGTLSSGVDSDESSNDSLGLSKYVNKKERVFQSSFEQRPSQVPVKFAEKKLATLSFDAENSRVQRNTRQKNKDFYSNKIASAPNGAKIEDLLKNWKGDYLKLEQHHGYIQWLFPIPEAGLNMHAQPLTFEEAEFIRKSEIATSRIKRAFCLMLDFFGMELVDDDRCTVRRAENWKERFAHLNRSSHNYLRITRILKCLAEVGQLRLQESFIQFLVDEVFVKSTLSNCRRSCREFWLPTITDFALKEELRRVIRSQT